MNPSLLVSVAVTFATVLIASLWAVLLATGLAPVPDSDPQGRRDRPRDIRTW